MEQQRRLANGFITVEEAIELIKQDTRDKAVVDLQFLTNNIPFLKVKQNYNIRLLKTLDDGRVVYNGERYVTIMSNYEKEILKKAILDAFAVSTGKQLDADNYGINRITTVVEGEGQTVQNVGRPQVNTTSTVKVGDDISNSYTRVVEAD